MSEKMGISARVCISIEKMNIYPVQTKLRNRATPDIAESFFDKKDPSREALLREIDDLRKEAPLHLPL